MLKEISGNFIVLYMEKDYLSIARQWVKEKVGEDFDVTAEMTKDYDDIFCFSYQSKEFLNTNDYHYFDTGIDPQLIIKIDSRFIPFGSGYTFEIAAQETRKKLLKEKSIKMVCPNYNYWEDNYVLIIHQVFDEAKLISILKSYRATYIVPEVIGNSIHRVGKAYTQNDLIERFNNLPATFHTLYGFFSEVLLELIESFCCELNIVPKEKKKYASYIEHSIPTDYEIIW